MVAAVDSLLAVDVVASVTVAAVAAVVVALATVVAVEVVAVLPVEVAALLAVEDVVVPVAVPVVELRLLSSPTVTLVSSLPAERRISLSPRT